MGRTCHRGFQSQEKRNIKRVTLGQKVGTIIFREIAMKEEILSECRQTLAKNYRCAQEGVHPNPDRRAFGRLLDGSGELL